MAKVKRRAETYPKVVLPASAADYIRSAFSFSYCLKGNY